MSRAAGVVNVVVAGLGGQGVLTASDIVAGAAFRAGLDVKKSEVHGMSQRGGSVVSDVRFGPRVDSPMVPPGEGDYLVLLSDDGSGPARATLRAGGVLIAPDRIGEDALKGGRTLNLALLGVLSAHLSIGEEHWLAAIRSTLPERVLEANLQAFSAGRRAVPPEGAANRGG
jgi:indolepyruvate ferredoxin oxidoreductase, beta subunit